jgi:tRNA dimethylallyltransferase
MFNPPAVFLMGPTASGKTDVAVYLAERLPCEIISVDSTLVYRGLDIGSAKPDSTLLSRAPHRLMDIRDPSSPYSVAEFREDALREMAEISTRGKIPLLVGGTMLYFKALRDGLASMPSTDPDVRARITAEAAAAGWPAMHRKLAVIDPQSAARLHPHQSQRIGRALEVYAMTGETLSALQARQVAEPLPYRVLQLGLIPDDRTQLYSRIDRRFDNMMDRGFLEEVESLYQRKDLHRELPAIRAVGYRQAWDFLSQRDMTQQVGENLTRELMIERAKIASRQLAKRQLTWLRGWPELQTVTVDFTTDSVSVVGANCLRTVNAFLYPDA